MLTLLTIKNYALISHTSIPFKDGFSIITGETGAGKSILLDALGLVLGRRADRTALRNESEKCIVEAHFDIKAYGLLSFFESNDLDYEDTTIIRREILPSGKSRAFINDSPATLPVLSSLATQLLDIHSQHQTHDLFENSYQLNILDVLSKSQPLRSAYGKLLTEYKSSLVQLQGLQNAQREALQQQDYFAFLYQELVDVQLRAGEQQDLEQQQEKLSNVETLSEHLGFVHRLLEQEQVGVLSQLREIKQRLQKISGISSEYQELLDRINSAEIELKDFSAETTQLAEHLINDPTLLEETISRLQIIYHLQKKHQVSSVDELLDLQTELFEKLDYNDQLSEQITRLENHIEVLTKQLKSKAADLHENRMNIIPQLKNKIQTIVSELGMPYAQFEYQLETADQFFSSGMDTLEVYFSANKGMPFVSLKKAASGGEMSRIMLAVKAILAQHTQLPTIIFDEIDTGVSGDVANKMGNIMQQMSKKMQVFGITHLPQVAAKGNQHYKVSKTQSDEGTVSDIQLLDEQERVLEIAQMLSGVQITDEAVANAKILLK